MGGDGVSRQWDVWDSLWPNLTSMNSIFQPTQWARRNGEFLEPLCRRDVLFHSSIDHTAPQDHEQPTPVVVICRPAPICPFKQICVHDYVLPNKSVYHKYNRYRNWYKFSTSIFWYRIRQIRSSGRGWAWAAYEKIGSSKHPVPFVLWQDSQALTLELAFVVLMSKLTL